MGKPSTQLPLRLAFGVHHGPADAPARVLRLIESEAQALAVSIRAGGHKLAYIAACVGKSEGYVSRMARGARPIPHKLVAPLCAATGSNLLAQYLQLQRALQGHDTDATDLLAEMLREAA